MDILIYSHWTCSLMELHYILSEVHVFVCYPFWVHSTEMSVLFSTLWSRSFRRFIYLLVWSQLQFNIIGRREIFVPGSISFLTYFLRSLFSYFFGGCIVILVWLLNFSVWIRLATPPNVLAWWGGNHICPSRINSSPERPYNDLFGRTTSRYGRRPVTAIRKSFNASKT